MINKLEQLQNFQDSVESRDALDRLRALQYMQAQSQGLMGLPVVQRQGGGGAGVQPQFLPQSTSVHYGGRVPAPPGYSGGERGLPSSPIRQNIPQQPEENVVNIPIAAQGNLELNTASITPTEITPQMMAAPEAPIEAIGPTGQELPQPTGLASMGGSGFSPLRAAKEGGPIVHRWGKQFGTIIPELAAKAFEELPTENIDGSGVSATAMKVPFLGGSGVYYPDPNVSQEEALRNLENLKGPMGTPSNIGALFQQGMADIDARNLAAQEQVLPTPQVVPEAGPSMSTLADINADTLSRNGEGAVFSYGDQNYQASSGGPTLLHGLTEEGARNRAIRGGLIDYEGRAPTYAPDRSTLSEADMFRTPRGYGPSPDLFNRPIMPEGFVPPPEVPGVQPTFEALEGQPINPPTAITRSELPGYGTELNWTDPYGNVTMAPTHEGPYAIENIQPPALFGPETRQPISDQALVTQTVLDQPQVIPPLSGPNIQGFKSKELAMTHARENPNQQQGLVNVYQLPDGSWDYQKVARGGTPMGLAMAGGGQIADTAQGLESLGRKGDEILVHMSPEELQGLSSLGDITYNPITGLPEAWSFRNIFKAVRKIAPIALTMAAPFLLGPGGLGVFSSGFGASALGTGLATGIGSVVGNLIAGAKPKDALKSGLMSGVFAGGAAKLGGAPWSGGARAGTGQMAAMSPGSASLKAGMDVPKPTGYGVTPGAGAPPIPSQITPVSSPLRLGGTTPRGYTAPRLGGQVPQTVAQATPIDSAQLALERPVPTYGGVRPQQIMPAEQVGISQIGESPLVQDPTGTLKTAGSNLWKELQTGKGLAKAVAIDLGTPDWEAEYAAMDAAKKRQLSEAGYTVDTGFDGQTVIRDSSGVVQPSNLSIQDILDRAYGRTPRTRLVERYGYEPTNAAQGGLISLAGGGDFRGRVEGRGHGMEDNIFMPIKDKGKEIGTLAVSPAEYVVDAHTMSALGNGNANQGAKVMDGVVESVRKKAYGTVRQPNEIDGLQALKPLMERV